MTHVAAVVSLKPSKPREIKGFLALSISSATARNSVSDVLTASTKAGSLLTKDKFASHTRGYFAHIG